MLAPSAFSVSSGMRLPWCSPGHRSVAAVVGHDFGAPVAAYCTLIRPEVLRSVVLMSAPAAEPPTLPFSTVGQPTTRPSSRTTDVTDRLSATDTQFESSGLVFVEANPWKE
jgi:pimeloyl-ACP methyl ester carboxylesterase